MSRSLLLPSLLLTACFVCSTEAQQNRRPRPAEDYPFVVPETGVKVDREVYKTIGDVELNAYVFTPKGHGSSHKRAAVVFFFGGGWTGGSPTQFEEHCKYLASRGMVALTVDYRVRSRHGTKAVACVADGKSALRWIRVNAGRLGVDPHRLAAGGGSAGGHVAACTGTIPGFEEKGEDTSVSSVPNAMVLFNPAVVLAPVEGLVLFRAEMLKSLADRMGTDPRNLSPYHHVKKDTPPTILFHGTSDTTVPFETARRFAEAMTAAGASCRLIPFEDRPHGFFNFGRAGGGDYVATVRAMDQFFIELGYLDGQPTIE